MGDTTLPHFPSRNSLASAPSPSVSESHFSVVDLADSPSFRSDTTFPVTSPKHSADALAAIVAGAPTARSLAQGAPQSLTAINAEPLLAHVRGIDADIQELQNILMRVSSSVDEARTISDRAELEEMASSLRKELESAIALVKNNIKGQVSLMQQDTSASLEVPGCGVGSPSFHMRQTVASAVKNKIKRRRDNALDLESLLNMGIRDTAKRRYFDVIGSSPSDDLVDRLCSPAPPECKLGTLVTREPQVDEKMSGLLKEMEVRTAMAIDTSKKLGVVERELTFVVDILEHEELAMDYELSVEKSNRRSMFLCILLAFVVFLLVVFVIPGLAVFL